MDIMVNTSEGAVGAYTGKPDTDGASMSAELKTFYDTELLENARTEMFYAQLAKKQPLPNGRGKTIEWRKWNTFARADKLQEGVIPTGQKFGVSYKTGALEQYGTYAAISDTLELHAYDDVILGAAEEMGASAAETQEKLIRDALMTGGNVLYCDALGEDMTPVRKVTRQSEMSSSAEIFCALTPDMVAKAVTKLKKDRVPTIGGRYVAVIHPSVAYDLRRSKDWIEAHKYAAAGEIFNGEIGELHGVRFIEDVFAPVLRGGDLASDARSLKINHTGGYSGSITSVTFQGGTVAAGALKGRVISINEVDAVVTDNTATTLTFEATDFGTVLENCPIYPGEGAGDGTAAYATFFFGKDAFGIVDPEGGALQMIVHDKSEGGGPLNQFSTVGYKLETNGATILYPERLLRVMSCSSYSDVDEAN